MLVIPLLYLMYVDAKTDILNSNPNSAGYKVKFVLVSADLQENPSVGNEWNYNVEIDGHPLDVRNPLILDVNSRAVINTVVTEEDSIPDVGRNKSYFSLYDYDMSNKVRLDYNIKVRENRGRYTGNVALWGIASIVSGRIKGRNFGKQKRRIISN